MALVVDTTTYSLVINSADRISGTNNNATYQINWRDFLPDNFNTYKVAFSFQTIGGYYSDGTFSTAGTNLGYTSLQTSVGITAVGAVAITLNNLGGFLAGQVVVCNGVPVGTLVTGYNGTTINLSAAITAAIPAGTPIYGYLPANVGAATFSSARVLMLNQGRSFSFDTQSKGPSTNVGILQRDIQLASSKSNALSCFYCQNPPRTMARPNQNLMTINILNNYSFAGGIVGYNNLVPVYSAVATNQNFLTDTNLQGTILATDMTGYTMLVEFIPIASSLNGKTRAGI